MKKKRKLSLIFTPIVKKISLRNISLFTNVPIVNKSREKNFKKNSLSPRPNYETFAAKQLSLLMQGERGMEKGLVFHVHETFAEL